MDRLGHEVGSQDRRADDGRGRWARREGVGRRLLGRHRGAGPHRRHARGAARPASKPAALCCMPRTGTFHATACAFVLQNPPHEPCAPRLSHGGRRSRISCTAMQLLGRRREKARSWQRTQWTRAHTERKATSGATGRSVLPTFACGDVLRTAPLHQSPESPVSAPAAVAVGVCIFSLG